MSPEGTNSESPTTLPRRPPGWNTGEQPPKRNRLNLAERITAAQMAAAGYRYADIGRALGRCQDAAKHAVEDARSALQTGSLLRVSDWASASRAAAKKGNHVPAKEWLLHSGVIEPLAEKPAINVQLAVGIGLPGLPGTGESAPNLSVSVSDPSPAPAIEGEATPVTTDGTST